MKTNAARILERAGVAYELLDYDTGDEHLTAEQVAAQVGLPFERVYKTLVVRGDDRSVCFAVVPAGAELDLKALARAAGRRKMALVPLAEVRPLTGYVRGGTTALGARRDYPVFADASMVDHERIAVSAGVRGTQLYLAPSDYVRVTGATLAPIARR